MEEKHLSRIIFGGLFLLMSFSFANGRYRDIVVAHEEGLDQEYHLSTFGYLAGGYLSINISNVNIQPTSAESYVFVLEKHAGFQHQAHGKEDNCSFPQIQDDDSNVVAFFKFAKDMKSLQGRSKSLLITNSTDQCSSRPTGHRSTNSSKSLKPGRFHVPFTEGTSVNSVFAICVTDEEDEGQYVLSFHACSDTTKFSFEVHLVERNPGPNYLPSGQIALPLVYGLMSIVFGLSGLFWIVFLCRHDETVFKIHYLMFVLVLLKTLSLMFHSVDYHFIAVEGSPMQTFALLFYITYLTKGALLFSTLALVGSGWAFIKPVLSDKEKKIFLLVIPLQILANVAFIITETSEEGDVQNLHWRVVFVGVDLICCVAIMYPVVWSIKHLQSAAMSDGKAAISLRKLHLFRQFYMMVVTYFYLTRIISLLLKAGLPPSISWIHELFFETTTLAFFMITAYRFRPGSDNPYLQLQSEDEYEDDDYDDEDEEEETNLKDIMIPPSHSNTLTRVNHATNHVTNHVT